MKPGCEAKLGSARSESCPIRVVGGAGRRLNRADAVGRSVMRSAAFFLTAFALVMPTPALADGACFRLVLKDWGNLKDNELVCLFDEDDILTPGEEIQIARIIANAQRREERRQANLAAEYEKERAIEDARRAKCSVPLLWINCPPRTPESERYWQRTSRGSHQDPGVLVAPQGPGASLR